MCVLGACVCVPFESCICPLPLATIYSALFPLSVLCIATTQTHDYYITRTMCRCSLLAPPSPVPSSPFPCPPHLFARTLDTQSVAVFLALVRLAYLSMAPQNEQKKQPKTIIHTLCKHFVSLSVWTRIRRLWWLLHSLQDIRTIQNIRMDISYGMNMY